MLYREDKSLHAGYLDWVQRGYSAVHAATGGVPNPVEDLLLALWTAAATTFPIPPLP